MRPSNERVSDDDLIFPTSTVLVDSDWVDADLGLEEGAGNRVVGKRGRVVAQTVTVGGGAIGERVGLDEMDRRHGEWNRSE